VAADRLNGGKSAASCAGDEGSLACAIFGIAAASAIALPTLAVAGRDIAVLDALVQVFSAPVDAVIDLVGLLQRGRSSTTVPVPQIEDAAASDKSTTLECQTAAGVSTDSAEKENVATAPAAGSPWLLVGLVAGLLGTTIAASRISPGLFARLTGTSKTAVKPAPPAIERKAAAGAIPAEQAAAKNAVAQKAAAAKAEQEAARSGVPRAVVDREARAQAAAAKAEQEAAQKAAKAKWQRKAAAEVEEVEAAREAAAAGVARKAAEEAARKAAAEQVARQAAAELAAAEKAAKAAARSQEAQRLEKMVRLKTLWAGSCFCCHR
jgi:hypothetical protein